MRLGYRIESPGKNGRAFQTCVNAEAMERHVCQLIKQSISPVDIIIRAFIIVVEEQATRPPEGAD